MVTVQPYSSTSLIDSTFLVECNIASRTSFTLQRHFHCYYPARKVYFGDRES